MLISKIEVVKRNLNKAIKDFFGEDDPVSIHILSSAAHDILTALAKKGGIKNIFSELDIIIKPEFVEDFKKRLRNPYNFFKHATRDPDKTLEFNPQLTEMILLDSVLIYHALKRPYTVEMHTYLLWHHLKSPELLCESAFKDFIEKKRLDINWEHKNLFLEVIKLRIKGNT